ncbi:VOC family protein [Hansschlegelia quercus]|uniref:VOC family protein n=1 Tax=Hansschlegelia quercus TaxID=2528245 RepID=A0A4Q9GPP6_9HYPH|nr:VOC family protein [Hansschlegelia quercus]TBN53587.1 VOC family protein [Hansschlegelia quercus]
METPSSAETAGSRSAAGVTSAGAPIRIGQVVLTVRDMEAVSRFYQDVVGLRVLETGDAGCTLGAGATPLLELWRDPDARRDDPRSAGLFHTAFLLPSRADLAAWMTHAADGGVHVEGASDHLVSEAFYLSDPEGNGVEIYADRPSETWEKRDGMIAMATAQLDLASLAAASTGGWTGAPEGSIIGHVHLRVGALAGAESFYGGALGLDIACRYPGATFFGSGGYHHHIAANVWRSSGAQMRPAGTTGLAEVRLIANAGQMEAIRSRTALEPAVESAPDRLSRRDPWGTSIIVTSV